MVNLITGSQHSSKFVFYNLSIQHFSRYTLIFRTGFFKVDVIHITIPIAEIMLITTDVG